MKKFALLIAFAMALAAISSQAQNKKPTDLRGVLLEQLRTSHSAEDWYVPANIAVANLTADQAKWTPGKDVHSVGQLTNHLLFWNTHELAEFKGEKAPAFSGNNDETFNNFNAAQWAETVQKLDAVMTEWEKAVEAADDQKLAANASLIAHVGAHNAYHIGQIILVRKLQGSWDPSKGVK